MFVEFLLGFENFRRTQNLKCTMTDSQNAVFVHFAKRKIRPMYNSENNQFTLKTKKMYTPEHCVQCYDGASLRATKKKVAS